MALPARRLLNALGVLVLAFAPFEPRPLLAAADLFRGMAIQLAYRWPTQQAMADEDTHAVLLWSAPADSTRSRVRRLLGVIAAVVVGVGQFVVSTWLLLFPFTVLMHVLRVNPNKIVDLQLWFVISRLALTAYRALAAYRFDAVIAARFPSPRGRRLRVDYLAAIPQGRGHGGRLLEHFLSYADEVDAEVVLNCDSRNLSLYRRHGFRVVGAPVRGQHLMARAQRSHGHRDSPDHRRARRPVQR